MKEYAEKLARAALEGFFDSPSFTSMDTPSRRKATARVLKELDKLNLAPAPTETKVSE